MNHLLEEMAPNYLQLRLKFSSWLNNILHFNSTFLQNSAEVQLPFDLMICLSLHLDKIQSWREGGSLYCGKKQSHSRARNRNVERLVPFLCSDKVTLD